MSCFYERRQCSVMATPHKESSVCFTSVTLGPSVFCFSLKTALRPPIYLLVHFPNFLLPHSHPSFLLFSTYRVLALCDFCKSDSLFLATQVFSDLAGVM